MAGWIGTVVPAAWASPQGLTLLFTLVMTGIVCILMGCGIPPTANYIIMATIAAPALLLLHVEPTFAPPFAFPYGVPPHIPPPSPLAPLRNAPRGGTCSP